MQPVKMDTISDFSHTSSTLSPESLSVGISVTGGEGHTANRIRKFDHGPRATVQLIVMVLDVDQGKLEWNPRRN